MFKFTSTTSSIMAAIKHNNQAVSRLALTLNHLRAVAPKRGKSTYTKVEQGSKFSADYKQYFTDHNGAVRSLMHDVPLDFDPQSKTVNMIVEIPRWTHGKFEINTKLEGNPITQDVKKGKVRFIKNVFPHHGYVHNYGALPQTWEDTTNSNGALNLYGDNDPLDVVEIGSKVYETGDIVRVKILGSLALIDDGELDWKVLVVNVEDPLAQKLNGLADIEAVCPGLLDSTRNWFRDYKLPDGKPQNQFAFEGQYKDQDESVEVVEENHKAWQKLIAGHVKGDNLPNIANSTLPNTPGFKQLDTVVESRSTDSELPFEVYESYYRS